MHNAFKDSHSLHFPFIPLPFPSILSFSWLIPLLLLCLFFFFGWPNEFLRIPCRSIDRGGCCLILSVSPEVVLQGKQSCSHDCGSDQWKAWWCHQPHGDKMLMAILLKVECSPSYVLWATRLEMTVLGLLESPMWTAVRFSSRRCIRQTSAGKYVVHCHLPCVGHCWKKVGSVGQWEWGWAHTEQRGHGLWREPRLTFVFPKKEFQLKSTNEPVVLQLWVEPFEFHYLDIPVGVVFAGLV